MIPLSGNKTGEGYASPVLGWMVHRSRPIANIPRCLGKAPVNLLQGLQSTTLTATIAATVASAGAGALTRTGAVFATTATAVTSAIASTGTVAITIAGSLSLTFTIACAVSFAIALLLAAATSLCREVDNGVEFVFAHQDRYVDLPVEFELFDEGTQVVA